MRAKLGQLQVEKLHFFTQNLANHLNMFLNSLEEANKDTSFPVTDAETSNHLCFKAIAKNEDTQGSLSKAIANNGDENSKKKAIKHFLAVKDGGKPENKRKRPFSCLQSNKKYYSDNSSWKYKPSSGGNASDSNEDDDNEINVNRYGSQNKATDLRG